MDPLKCTIRSTFELSTRASFVVVLNSWDEELSNKNLLHTENKEVVLPFNGIEILDADGEGFPGIVIKYADEGQLQCLRSLKENDSIYLTQM
ncbi:MAG: hypothetical protein V4553_15540 [Bacteroidota bacterium]